MKSKLTTTLAITSLGICCSQAALIAWQTTSQGMTGQVTTSTNGGSGYVLDGTAGVSYDYGALDAIGGAAVDGSAVEFIFNLSNSGQSISLGSFYAWSPGNEIQNFKLEQYPDTGKFGLTTPGFWDKSLTTDSLFDQDVHVVLRRNNDSGTLDLFVNGVFAETESTKTNWRQDGGAGYIGSSNNGTADAATGTIYGVASYSAAISNADVTTLYNAWAAPVPEPSSTTLLGLGGLALILRRRK